MDNWDARSIKLRIIAAFGAFSRQDEAKILAEARGGVDLASAASDYLRKAGESAGAIAAGYLIHRDTIGGWVERVSDKLNLNPSADEWLDDGTRMIHWPNGKRAAFVPFQGIEQQMRQLGAHELGALPPPSLPYPVTCEWPRCACGCHVRDGNKHPCFECHIAQAIDEDMLTCGKCGGKPSECGHPRVALTQLELAQIRCTVHDSSLAECGCPAQADRLGFDLSESMGGEAHDVAMVDVTDSPLVAAATEHEWLDQHHGELFKVECIDCGLVDKWMNNGNRPTSCARCESQELRFAIADEQPADPAPHVADDECGSCGHKMSKHIFVEHEGADKWGCCVNGCPCVKPDQKAAQPCAGGSSAMQLARTAKVKESMEATTCCVCEDQITKGEMAYGNDLFWGHEVCVEVQAEREGFMFDDDDERCEADDNGRRCVLPPHGEGIHCWEPVEDEGAATVEGFPEEPTRDWVAECTARGFHQFGSDGVCTDCGSVQEKAEPRPGVSLDPSVPDDLSANPDWSPRGKPGDTATTSEADTAGLPWADPVPSAPGDDSGASGEKPAWDPTHPNARTRYRNECQACGKTTVTDIPSGKCCKKDATCVTSPVRCSVGCTNGVEIDGPKGPRNCPECFTTGCQCGHGRHRHPDGKDCEACPCVSYRPGREQELETQEMKDEALLRYAQGFDMERKPKRAGKAKTYRLCKLCNRPIMAGELFTIPKGKGPKASSSRRAHLDCIKGTIERLSKVADAIDKARNA